jgi:hypothetical protein
MAYIQPRTTQGRCKEMIAPKCWIYNSNNEVYLEAVNLSSSSKCAQIAPISSESDKDRRVSAARMSCPHDTKDVRHCLGFSNAHPVFEAKRK